jgi:hypothetical protein
VLISLSEVDLPARRVTGDPTNAGKAADWSTLGLAAAAIAGTFLEPDPEILWDDPRLTSVRAALAAQLQSAAMAEPNTAEAAPASPAIPIEPGPAPMPG